MGASSLFPSVRRAVSTVAPGVALTNAGSIEDFLNDSAYARPRFSLITLASFAGIGLALVAIGVFCVMAYSVSLRTHEIGVRMALGAQKADVLWMVIGNALRLSLVGVGVGVAAALALTHFLSSLLYGVKPTDPLTFIAVSLILTGVALLACYIPARRATKVDPMVALRYE